MSRKKFKKRYEELKELPDNTEMKKFRGRQFEELICDLFEAENILLKRPYHTHDDKSEQIDGAIKIENRILLIETKWVESGLAASDLYAFQGKVERKLAGTLGLFISQARLHDNFIDSIIKSHERRILILHEEDVDHMFSMAPGELSQYLSSAMDTYSYDNVKHLAIGEYLQKKKKLTLKNDAKISNSGFQELRKFVVTPKKRNREEIAEKVAGMDTDAQVAATKFFLKGLRDYSELSTIMYYNVEEALQQLLISTASLTYKLYLTELAHYKASCLFDDPIWNRYFSEYKTQNKPNQQKLHRIAIDYLQKWSGNYAWENILTEKIRMLWSDMTPALKTEAARIYIDFYFSDRRDGYPQKVFAKKIVNEDSAEVQVAKEQFLNDKIQSIIKDSEVKTLGSKNLKFVINVLKNGIYNVHALIQVPPNKMDPELTKRIKKIYKEMKSPSTGAEKVKRRNAGRK